jgi:hypothetical protein
MYILPQYPYDDKLHAEGEAMACAYNTAARIGEDITC